MSGSYAASTRDSRRVGKDWIFISRLGTKGEGKAYVREALDKGAVVIMEERCAMRDVYVCADVQKALITLSSALYPAVRGPALHRRDRDERQEQRLRVSLSDAQRGHALHADRHA